MKDLKKVNIFCGRFQPFHKGHLKCCEDAYKKNGYPVFIFYVPNKQFDISLKENKNISYSFIGILGIFGVKV